MAMTNIIENVVAMMIFALLAKVAGHMLRKVQAMPDAKKNSLGMGAIRLADLAMNVAALVVSMRTLRGLLQSQEPITRIDIFGIALFTWATFQLLYMLIFGEAQRTKSRPWG